MEPLNLKLELKKHTKADVYFTINFSEWKLNERLCKRVCVRFVTNLVRYFCEICDRLCEICKRVCV